MLWGHICEAGGPAIPPSRAVSMGVWMVQSKRCVLPGGEPSSRMLSPCGSTALCWYGCLKKGKIWGCSSSLLRRAGRREVVLKMLLFWDESPSQPIHQERSRTLWQKTHRPLLFYTESNGPWAGVSTDLLLCGSGSSFPCEDSVCPDLCGWLQAPLLTVWWDMANLQTMV